MDEARIRAAQGGDTVYLGDSCERCGTVYKYVSTGKCAECTKKRARTRYADDKRVLDEARGK